MHYVMASSKAMFRGERAGLSGRFGIQSKFFPPDNNFTAIF